ncbi:hypothetical protein SporoP37_07675 [Sporosarcina sp. P37]|uniref:DUF4064 domain-containing protein n=1 Tax=unclassified Sporosarcina TaxID=2647733 RepID=UPI000A17B9D4|nr:MULTISPECIES: DUF4064 domain-containing protein [unclassified Sporosarcina]ARK24551.1 hypothetical protein SporoP37_07675 [Sporosarcina sp. P37]PID19708.1 DUF4064 domain-containing protein [Sporosarcina sp. P35]
MIKRTAERVLAIIAMIFIAISLAGTAVIGFFWNMASTDPAFMEEFRAAMVDEGVLNMDEVDMFMSFMDSFSIVFWLAVIALFIGLVLSIIGLVKIWNNANPKAAGILFIIAGLFGGILSLPSILLYIAGILCFTRKPPMAPGSSSDEYASTESNWMN